MSDATGRDIRDAVVQDTTGYELTTRDVERLFAEALVPKSLRSIQRMCKSGHLDAREFQTEHGLIFKINRDSVERRIMQLQQERDLNGGDDLSRPVATGDDRSSSVAAQESRNDSFDVSRRAAAHDDTGKRRDVSQQEQSHEIDSDRSRQATTSESVATGDDRSVEIVRALEKRVEIQKGIIEELEASRADDQVHYSNLRKFVKEQTDQLYEDHARLRNFTMALLQIPGVRQAAEQGNLELPAGIPAMPTDDVVHDEPDSEPNPASGLAQ